MFRALVAAKLLKPLAILPLNGIKFFATADLLELAKDRSWLVRMSSTIYQHWRKKNSAKKNCSLVSEANGQSPVVAIGG